MSSQVILLLSLVAAVAATKPFVGYPLPFYPKSAGASAIVKSKYGFQVSLQWGVNDPTHFCSGAILNSSWVLTTNRCASVVPPYGDFVVKVGTHSLKDTESTLQTIRVENTITHERYKGHEGYYDVALLKLAKPIILNNVVKTIRLVDEYERSGYAEMLSWGSSWRMYTPFTQEQLQITKLNLINHADCVNKIQSITNSTFAPGTYQICGVPESRAFSSCESEPGAPLVVYNGTEPLLMGLATWGVVPCGISGTPLMFEVVTYYLDWIAAKLQSN